MKQTETEFRENFKMKTSIVAAGKKDLSGNVVISIINSLHNLEDEKYHDIFDVVIIDEAHHSSSFSGMFYDVLTNIIAPVKIGLTATPPDKIKSPEKAMACEGLIGPVIGAFTVPEAVNIGRLTRPRLVLLNIPPNANLRDLRTYGDSWAGNTYTPGIYTMGIVKSRIRNNIIANYIRDETKKGKTALIFVKILEHATIFHQMLTEKGIKCEIVNSTVSGDKREAFRLKLHNKALQCIVATAAWKEGINIPALDIVFNAAGYQDITPVTQMAGRVLRIYEGKEEAIIGDCLDIGKYLSVHCIQRLQTYKNLEWL
jgi:superfamily II DNA or RNA helicase